MPTGYGNRAAWIKAQSNNQVCCETKKLLASGKPPPKALGKYTGEYWNDVRCFYRESNIAKDGLLVVKSDANEMSGNIYRERIVIPRPLVPALLYHMHNNVDQHPTRAQQRAQFQRQFFAVNLDKHLDILYKNCYKCAIIQKLPNEIIQNETKTDAEKPHTNFHADVIKRACQNILIIRDHFSSYLDAMIIKSKKSIDLKEGIIQLTSSMRKPGQIFVSVDNAPGFKSLINKEDQDLKSLRITMVKTDELNKNSNAIVDRACQELEEELRRLEPEGDTISNATLKLAVMNLNSKLRRRGKISAFEINSSRDQNTGEHLSLDDEKLRNEQLETRKDTRTPAKTPHINVGDTVKVKNSRNKHKADNIYLVTNKNDEDVTVQRILHPLKKIPTKIMSTAYKTKAKLLHQPKLPASDDSEEQVLPMPTKKKKEITPWNPFNTDFFYDSDSESEEPNVHKWKEGHIIPKH